MPVYKYEVLNPVTDKKKPFFDKKSGFFRFKVAKPYRYYIECAITNPNTGGRDYYILLSTFKFDDNCRLCKVDNYSRVAIKLRGELKEYIIRESKWRGNVTVIEVEQSDEYDSYRIE